jgi:hypothetical protein
VRTAIDRFLAAGATAEEGAAARNALLSQDLSARLRAVLQGT